MRKAISSLITALVVAFAFVINAQPPEPIAGDYPHVASVIAKLGESVVVPPEDLEGVLDPGGSFTDVSQCSYVAAPVGEDDTQYGDVRDTSGGIEYTVASEWWKRPGVLTCLGFEGATDVVWYSAESVVAGDTCSDDPLSPNLGTFYFEVEFEADPEDNTPIVADYPRFYPNEEPYDGETCSITCVDGTTDIPLSDLLLISYTNMSAMFENTFATPIGAQSGDPDIFIETDSSFNPEGACWPVLDVNMQETDLWKACYTAGADRIWFTMDSDATPEELVAGSPYMFTVGVTNLQGGRTTFDVVLTYPCDCCARTRKGLELVVEEGGDPVDVPWTQWFAEPLCGEGLSNDYQIVTNPDTIMSAGWATFWGGWENGSLDVIPSEDAKRERLLAQSAFRYTPPGFGYVECCDFEYDWFYIRATCYTNLNYGTELDAEWVEISFDQTQVRIKVMNSCHEDGLTLGEDSYSFNMPPVEAINDPCYSEPGIEIPLCMGEHHVHVCTLLGSHYIDVPDGNCRDDLYISMVGWQGVPNVTKLGGTVYIEPGPQASAKVIYNSPMYLTQAELDEFEYTVVDLRCGSEVTATATALIDPCFEEDCTVAGGVIKIDVCEDGEQVELTAEDIISAIQWPEMMDSCGIDPDSICVTGINVDPTCDLQGSWRAWPGSGCDPYADCEDDAKNYCIDRFLYTAVPSAFARPGTDRFGVNVRYERNGVIHNVYVEIRFVVRPVSVDGPTAVDVVGESIDQDGGYQIALSAIHEAIFTQLSGFYGSPEIDEDCVIVDDANLVFAFNPISAEGGSVRVVCEEGEDESDAPGLIWIDLIGCSDPNDPCCTGDLDECYTDIGLDIEQDEERECISCQVELKPASGFIGTDVIEYYVWDGTVSECGGELNMTTGTISVEVIRNLLSPQAYDDYITAHKDEKLFVNILELDCYYASLCGVPAGSILGNDSWASGAALSLELLEGPSSGLFNFRADGAIWTFSFLPEPGFVGVETFVYRIYDETQGLYSQPATVYIHVVDITAGSRYPTLTWPDIVEGAEWYQVWLGRRPFGSASGTPYTLFYSDWLEGMKEWTPTAGLPGGDYALWVRGWSSVNGMSGWLLDNTTPVVEFSIETAVPGEVDLIAPSGVVGNHALTYIWSKDANATWYRLWVGRNGVRWFDAWMQGDGVGLMERFIQGHPSASSYDWYVRPWGPDGFAPDWSGPESFERP